MKVRSGFVSNSSSSSFLIYGAAFDAGDDLEEFAKQVGVNVQDENEKDGISLDAYDLAEKIAEAIGISYEIGQEVCSVYFGVNATAIKDNETGKEFRDNIKGILAKAAGKEIRCSYHSECYRDG